MITLNHEHHLGHRALFIMLLRSALPAIGLAIIVLVFGVLSGPIEASINSTGDMAFLSSSVDVSSVHTYLSWFLSGLAILTIIVFLIEEIAAILTYINCTFTLEEFNLKLRRGIFNLEEVSIPYRQMQDINIDRSLFYRILGVSRMIIDSAGHEEADEKNETHIMLEPIGKNMAEELMKTMQRRIGVQVVETDEKADKEAAKL